MVTTMMMMMMMMMMAWCYTYWRSSRCWYCWSEDATLLSLWRHGQHCLTHGVNWPRSLNITILIDSSNR